jgi:hypothetical protein
MRHVRCVAVAAIALSLWTSVAASQGVNEPRESPHLFALELKAPRALTAWLESVRGGTFSSTVVSEPLEPGRIDHQHLGQPGITPIVLRSELTELAPLLAIALGPDPSTLDGDILIMDFNHRAARELSFMNARLTEIGFGPFDARSPAPCTSQVTLAAEAVRWPAGPWPSPNARLERVPRCSSADFEVSIPGLEEAMKSVTRIDSIRLERPVAEALSRVPRASSGWRCRNIRLTLLPAHTAALEQWRRELVTKGASESDRTLELHLRSGGRDVLVLRARGVELVALQDERLEAGSATDARMIADFSVRQWELVSAPR